MLSFYLSLLFPLFFLLVVLHEWLQCHPSSKRKFDCSKRVSFELNEFQPLVSYPVCLLQDFFSFFDFKIVFFLSWRYASYQPPEGSWELIQVVRYTGGSHLYAGLGS